MADMKSYVSILNLVVLMKSCTFFRYGLGMIFYKKEKFTLAEAHFKKALAINPQSAVLLCHIGLVSITSYL